QDAGPPTDPAPAEGSAEAPPSSAASPEGESPAVSLSPSPSPSKTVLLMKDGSVRVFDHPAVEGRDAYVVSLGIGEVRVPKAQVEARFGSMREAYEYQRDHLPDRDPDEHMRLARWCLSHRMEAEAAEQLRALLSWSPGDGTAETMLRSLEVSLAARADRDEG